MLNTFVICRCKTLTINVDKRWCNVIKHFYEKILINILRKYFLILINVLLISYLYCLTLSIFIISLILSLWLLNIFLMFYSCLLRIFLTISFQSFTKKIENIFYLLGYIPSLLVSLSWGTWKNYAQRVNWHMIGSSSPSAQLPGRREDINSLPSSRSTTRWRLVASSCGQ